jgi:hypothetical protein
MQLEALVEQVVAELSRLFFEEAQRHLAQRATSVQASPST